MELVRMYSPKDFSHVVLLIQAGIVDPFELALQLEKQIPGSATGGCCSTNSSACCK